MIDLEIKYKIIGNISDIISTKMEYGVEIKLFKFKNILI